jgi:hypothetical protein
MGPRISRWLPRMPSDVWGSFVSSSSTESTRNYRRDFAGGLTGSRPLPGLPNGIQVGSARAPFPLSHLYPQPLATTRTPPRTAREEIRAAVVDRSIPRRLGLGLGCGSFTWSGGSRPELLDGSHGGRPGIARQSRIAPRVSTPPRPHVCLPLSPVQFPSTYSSSFPSGIAPVDSSLGQWVHRLGWLAVDAPPRGRPCAAAWRRVGRWRVFRWIQHGRSGLNQSLPIQSVDRVRRWQINGHGSLWLCFHRSRRILIRWPVVRTGSQVWWSNLDPRLQIGQSETLDTPSARVVCKRDPTVLGNQPAVQVAGNLCLWEFSALAPRLSEYWRLVQRTNKTREMNL